MRTFFIIDADGDLRVALVEDRDRLRFVLESSFPVISWHRTATAAEARVRLLSAARARRPRYVSYWLPTTTMDGRG